MSRRNASRNGKLLAASGVAIALLLGLAPLVGSTDDIEFTDVRAQTLQFMEWERTIELTEEQEAIKKEALTAVPAPCCSDNSAYTCCCPCNSRRAWWGLTHYLIAEKGWNAEQVQAKVEDWFEFINPDGFSGDACYTRGCGRPFSKNGCGGMNPAQVQF